MKTGDLVRIHPHGDEFEAAIGRVLVWSTKGLACALEFDDPPPFRKHLLDTAGIFIHRNYITMLLIRESLDGKPWGPWTELIGGGHYEIENPDGTPIP